MREPFQCSLKISGLPRLQSGVVHWRVRAKERKTWRDKVAWAIREAGVKPPSVALSRAHLSFTRHSTQEPDHDNLAASFKPVLDGLIGLIIADDSPAVIGTPMYRWGSAPPRGGYVTIEVREGVADVCSACGQALVEERPC